MKLSAPLPSAWPTGLSPFRLTPVEIQRFVLCGQFSTSEFQFQAPEWAIEYRIPSRLKKPNFPSGFRPSVLNQIASGARDRGIRSESDTCPPLMLNLRNR